MMDNLVKKGGKGATQQSYIGCFADTDGDGIVDGIIFADLAESKSGTWGDSDGVYSYSAVSNLKEYSVSYDLNRGPILSPVSGTTGNDRFYIMALEDFTTSSYSTWYWYYSGKISDYATITNKDFGTGKQNTANMISKWNSSTYGSQNARDIWGAIQTKASDGWFVPSRAELAAFVVNLEITKSNYSSKGLSLDYWSSFLDSSSYAYRANLGSGYMFRNGVYNLYCVRLVKVF